MCVYIYICGGQRLIEVTFFNHPPPLFTLFEDLLVLLVCVSAFAYLYM